MIVTILTVNSLFRFELHHLERQKKPIQFVILCYNKHPCMIFLMPIKIYGQFNKQRNNEKCSLIN